MRAAGLLVFGLCLFSCSSGSGSNPGGTTVSWEQYCAGAAKRDEGCGDTPDQSSCVAQKSCFESYFRGSILSSLAQCLNSRTCGASDDPCFDAAGKAASSNVLSGYFTACNGWVSSCGGANDLCAPSAGVLNDTTLSTLGDCFSKSCTDAETCVGGVHNSIKCF
jgi:hypothetical protein